MLWSDMTDLTVKGEGGVSQVDKEQGWNGTLKSLDGPVVRIPKASMQQQPGLLHSAQQSWRLGERLLL